MTRNALLLGVLGTLACSDPVAPVGERAFLGILGTITVPATAVAGEPFVVTVVTTGNGCLLGPASTVLSYDGAVARMRVMDRWAMSSECTDEEVSVTHATAVVFMEPGNATVSIQALGVDSDVHDYTVAVLAD